MPDTANNPFLALLSSLARMSEQFKHSWREAGPFEMLTGLKPTDVSTAQQTGPLREDPFRTNAAAHAMTVKALTDRYGPNIAQLIGVLQEVPSGIANWSNQQPFTTYEGESGFSMPDLYANLYGAQSSPMYGTQPDVMGALVQAFGDIRSPLGLPGQGNAVMDYFRKLVR